MSNELVVIKSNFVNEFRYALTREEQKLLLFVISQINEDRELYENGFDVKIKDLLKVLEIKNSGNKYKYIVKMTKKIMEPVVFETDENIKVVSFFSIFDYNKKKGAVNVKMNPDLLEHFIDLKKQFVMYKLNNIMHLNSTYSIRIYEILKQNLFKKKINITIEELRKQLNILNHEYKVFSDFEKRVLFPSFHEINSKTDINFKFKKIRVGRSIGEIEFEISESTINESEIMDMNTGELKKVYPKRKVLTPKLIKTIEPYESQLQGLNTPKPELLQKALSFGIPDHLTNKWIDLKGIETVNEKLELLTQRSKTQKIASPVGFFISAIQQDWQDETKQVVKLTEEQQRELRKENPETVMMEPLNFRTEVEFYEEMGRLQNDFYIPRWAERDMIESEQNWARVTA
jgi:plasmid replication initiation protein